MAQGKENLNFNQDQKSLTAEIVNYLAKPKFLITPDLHRQSAAANIASGNLVEAIQNLEDARDAKRGIISIGKKSFDGATSTFIRDARNCSNKKIPEGVEAAEIIVLATFESAKDIFKFDNPKVSKEFYETQLQKMAVDFFNNFSAKNSTKSDKEIFHQSRKEMGKIADFLSSCGIKNPKRKLAEALHFQNFKQDENYNPVTISAIAGEDGHRHTIIEANVAFKGLTEEQKDLYDKIAVDGPLSPLQKSLMKEYREQIFSEKYVIPTQLINAIPGIRNAFEEINFLVRNVDEKSAITENDLEIIDVRKRAGALPTLLKDKNLTKEITRSNAKQANILMGGNGATLHWNSLNTDIPIVGPIFGEYESDIVRHTRKAAKEHDISFTSTPFNRFRRFGPASDLIAIDGYLNKLTDAISDNFEEAKILKQHLQPSKFSDRIKQFFKPLPSFEKTISDIESRSEKSDFVKIIKLAKNIRDNVDEASALVRFSNNFDEENISLKISTKFSRLTRLVNKAAEDEKSDLSSHCDIKKVPLEEVVTSCKSAKDRTGLNMFYRMAKIFKDEVKVSFAKICNVLHSSGHIEYLPGSFRVGGGAPGCYQLQKPVLGALPKSEKEFLKDIVGPFAHNSKEQRKSFSERAKHLFSSNDEVETKPISSTNVIKEIEKPVELKTPSLAEELERDISKNKKDGPSNAMKRASSEQLAPISEQQKSV